jgi:colanic acid/amylovoran biosynthesis glycosyltransferase
MNRPRILYVISRYTYQSTFIVREIEELCSRGWDIAVVSLRPPVFASRLESRALPYRVLHDNYVSVGVIAQTLRVVLTAAPIIFRFVWLVVTAYWRHPSLMSRNLAAVPKAAFYSRMLGHGMYSHVHAHWATVSTSTAMLMSKLSGVPFSFTGHAWDIFCDTTLLPQKIQAARFVLTCTEYNRQHLLGVADGHGYKVHVLYHGLPLHKYEPRRQERLGSTIRLLTVGRWTEKKGFLELVRALGLLRDRDIDFNLHIIAGAGSSSYERSVRNAIAEVAIEDRVTIEPWLPHERVVEAMRDSDILVLPCVRPANGAMDGIPNVLIEALSLQLPVVATRISGIPELVRHGETGLLVEERDPAGIAAAIAWYASHRTEAQDLAACGRRRVEEMFDIDRTTSALEQHFLVGASTPFGRSRVSEQS